VTIWSEEIPTGARMILETETLYNNQDIGSLIEDDYLKRLEI